MPRSAQQLRNDALAIWYAGVDAVAPARLVAEHVAVDGRWLRLGNNIFELAEIDRIAVVGAGKASAGMAVALEDSLGTALMEAKQLVGWVNVPANCLLPAKRIRVHAGRPAGVNEPRPEGVQGTQKILELVQALGPRDLCICLLSGGGSALLVAPVDEISLDEKVRITSLLSAAGANIQQLNTVRRQISRVKGGGLARACRAGQMASLIISDVLGDPLETIASGPTVDSNTTARDALAVLDELGVTNKPEVAAVAKYLRAKQESDAGTLPEKVNATNFVIGNNATAVDAAGVKAEQLGYSHAMDAALTPEGPAEDVGKHLADMARRMREHPGPDCLITGGEPVVHLANKTIRGRGGRNQQLVLAALAELGDCQGIALLSGGTDGEDGPTDAAGAVINEQVAGATKSTPADIADHLARNDAYPFFEATAGLIKTGPTHTNVCDLRVVTIERGV